MAGQWYDLLHYGQDPAWSSVYYLTPFEDPRGHFQEPRRNIEICATMLDIEIQYREEEEQVRVGNAIISKSPRVQRKFHLLTSRTLPKPPPKLSNSASFPKQLSVMETPVLSNPTSPKSLISFHDKADDFIEGTLSPVNYLTKSLLLQSQLEMFKPGAKLFPLLYIDATMRNLKVFWTQS